MSCPDHRPSLDELRDRRDEPGILCHAFGDCCVSMWLGRPHVRLDDGRDGYFVSARYLREAHDTLDTLWEMLELRPVEYYPAGDVVIFAVEP